jgi:hypothetical protein
MITLEKLLEYEEYRGYYDGFYLQKVKNGLNKTSDDEWGIIESLIQDIKLVIKGLASVDYANKLVIKLKERCDNDETINKFWELGKNE